MADELKTLEGYPLCDTTARGNIESINERMDDLFIKSEDIEEVLQG